MIARIIMNNFKKMIEQLIEWNIFKLLDGRNLYEGTEEELIWLFEEEVKKRKF